MENERGPGYGETLMMLIFATDKIFIATEYRILSESEFVSLHLKPHEILL
jgi:hypothetical protein